MSDIIPANTNNNSIELYSPKNYIINLEPKKLAEKCTNIITLALICKGDNKIEEDEEKTMAILLFNILQENFSHVSIDIIEKTLLKKHYGEGFVANVSSIIECLEKAGLADDSVVNKMKLAKEREDEYYRQKEEKQRKYYEEHKEEIIINFCNKCYNDYKQKGDFSDMFNIVFERLLEKKVSFTQEQITKAKEVATNKTRNYLQNKKTKEAKELNFSEVRRIGCIINSIEEIQKDTYFEDVYKHELSKAYFEKRYKNEQSK